MKKIFFALITLLTTQVFAFRVYPLQNSINIGSETATVFYVENPSQAPAPISIEVKRRKVFKDGSEKLTDASKYLEIFPKQVTLKPGEKRAIAVNLKDKKMDINEEMSFRLIAEQLPVDLVKTKKKQGMNLKVLYKYLASLYITKDSFKSHVTVEDIDRKGDKLAIELKNDGHRHQILNELKLKVKGKGVNGKEMIYEIKNPQMLKGMIGENILSGTEREFLIPYPKVFKTNTRLSVVLDYQNI